SGLTETTVLNGADFASVGNGNNVLENGESITICETVEVVNCISVFSDFEAFWGCNGKVCQSSISNANVVFPNLVPDLNITPIASMSSCLGPGSASQQQLRIINNGLGEAVNVQLDIFQATGTVYNGGLYSNIDENSFTLEVGTAPPISIIPDSTQTTSALSCLAPNPKGRAYITIPSINSGDTVFLKWDTYSCCHTDCNISWFSANGWRYQGSYENICQDTLIIPNAWGRVYAYFRDVMEDNGSPSWLSNGQTGTFNFLFATYQNTIPLSPGSFWKFVVAVPTCVTYGGNFHILNKDGVSVWNPSSVTTSGNEITAIFSGTTPWSLLQAEVKIDLTVDCSTCPGGSGVVSIESFFIPDTSCACELPITCESTSLVVICPSSCPEGISNFNAIMERSSYGLPDNNNDGVPDPPATIMDSSKVRTNRAMFGDTISSIFTGVIRTSGTNPFWDYCYASSSITNGNRMVFIDADLTIYQAGTGNVYACTNVPVVVTTSGTTREWEYDISVLGLIASGCVPGGFAYNDGDSLVLKAQYRINSNIGGNILQCFSTNEFYTSNIANPTATADQYWCNPAPSSFSIIGYYFATWGPNSYPVSSCNEVTIVHNYYLSIGPCCTNYSGGNLFPFEYRYWAHIKNLKVTLPPGFEYISARFRQVRTAGTLVSNASPWFALTPVDSTSDTLDFPVEQFNEGYGGTIPLSDDGFYGALEVTIAPSCRVTQDIPLDIQYDWTFGESDYLLGSPTSTLLINNTLDDIIYDGPELNLQALLPTINALDSTPSWDISISNASSIDAMNVWLAMPQIAGVSVVEVYDLDNSVVVPLTGNLYQLDTLTALAVRNLRITANFTSCALDSIIVYSGWNCNEGYPVDISAYPCPMEQITLKLSPQIATFVSNVTAPSIPIQLCDTTDYIIEGINIQLGTAYSLKLTIVLPIGATIIPGLSEISYPASNPLIPLSDPVFMGGTIWEWQLSALNTQLGVDGLKGILDPTLNTVKVAFKIVTDCNYTSGSIIGFNFNGTTACGLNIGQEFTTTAPLIIDGASEPYFSEIKLSTTFISPCANSTVLKVVVYNQGPLAFGPTDSIAVELPPGVTYVPGSFVPVNNAPLNPIPSQVVLNNLSYLTWQLPPGVAAGDSTVFLLNYVGDPTLLSCDINQFGARTTNQQTVNCVVTGTNCSINLITGDTTLPVFTFKANLSFSSASATAVPNPPLGETVSINYDLTNTGETILAGTNTTVSFYQDSDGDGSYSPGDIFLGNDTLTAQINNNATVSFSSTLDVASGNSCAIIAVLDTAINPCACNPSQILVNVPLTNAGIDTIICSDQVVLLGALPSNGYSYTWSPIIGLNDATIANPQLTIANLTALPDTNIYIVTTDRLACVTTDTVEVIVNPLPLADFATSNVCLQDSNSFVDLSTSGFGNIVSWFWNFGDAATSSLQNPSHVYNANGTYSVILGVITNTGCQDTVLHNLLVNPLPVPDFTAQSICSYDAAVFADASTISTGNITSWSWDFGDAFTSTLQNPTHNYLLDSVYQVSLTVISDSTCVNVTTQPILVHPVPIAAYASSNICLYDSVTFTDQSTLSAGNIGQWSWDFGDGNGGIQQNPAHQYLSPGAYNLMLIVTSDSGCTDTTVGSLAVHPAPAASFSTANVCLTDSAQFTNLSTISAGGIDGFQWDFGDGGISSQQDPTYQYQADGTYIVQLIAKTDSNCVDTFQTAITVYPNPNAALSVVNQRLYDSVVFNNQSSINTPDTIISWQWDFGDGNNAAQQLPSHLYSSDGAYNIELIVGSNNGCLDTFQTTVFVFPVPDALFSVGDDCADNPAVFNNQSTISSGGMDGYQWDFGDGVTSTEQSPQYVYSIDSVYTVQLIATSDSGCTDTTTAVTTRYSIPTANFEVTPQCLYDPLVFQDTPP
ncbi:MAG: PKD domain-containing protein, partial [Flavobacteriales bacterium]|nr:PKD domain-containing protein [Flavobacteriales bacterium]